MGDVPKIYILNVFLDKNMAFFEAILSSYGTCLAREKNTLNNEAEASYERKSPVYP